jgi:hypothetical protein
MDRRFAAPRRALLPLIALLLLVPLGGAARAIGEGDGFNVTLWNDYSAADAIESNRLAESIGARQVGYLVHMRQESRTSSDVRWLSTSPGTPFANAPAAAVLAAAIADARARGLEVTLVPFLGADQGGPRQQFWPRDRAAWFRSYGARMRELAAFGEANGVREMLVGSELSFLYFDERGWRAVIADVRGVFSGHLTISALFFEYPLVRFWDALDSVGVSAYYPLTFWDGIRDVGMLERVWRLHRAHLTAFAAAKGKPLTFAEVGYPATGVAARMPWDYQWGQRSLDQELQKRCFEAFRRVWSREPRLRRFSIWGLGPVRYDQHDTQGKGFLPIGKAAEDTVRRLFAERAAP